MALGLFLYYEEVMKMGQLVEKFFGIAILNEPGENGMGFGMFLESHPKDTYDEAKAYVEKHADHPSFERGSINKEFVTPARVEKLLSRREDSGFNDKGEAIDIADFGGFIQEENEKEEEARI